MKTKILIYDLNILIQEIYVAAIIIDKKIFIIAGKKIKSSSNDDVQISQRKFSLLDTDDSRWNC